MSRLPNWFPGFDADSSSQPSPALWQLEAVPQQKGDAGTGFFGSFMESPQQPPYVSGTWQHCKGI